jgi:hypothetical protein
MLSLMVWPSVMSISGFCCIARKILDTHVRNKSSNESIAKKLPEKLVPLENFILVFWISTG